MRLKNKIISVLCLAVCITLAGCNTQSWVGGTDNSISLSDIPDYTNMPYVAVNNNEPEFDESDFTVSSFETYGKLDSLGRCTGAYANIGKDLMPDEKRGSIGSVKPSGWHTVKYDIVEGGYLYNRCHLIGFQLTGENANENNLITGTRYMNVDGMLPFEDMVADYIKETGNHVLYRVTPVYEDNNLLASGVHMEAESVEDRGDSISYNVYVYNVQPGIDIDYATGESSLASTDMRQEEAGTYILNTNSHKFHKEQCSGVKDISDKNKEIFKGNRQILITNGYDPCKRCNP